MFKKMAVLLGVGLIVLWIAGLGSPEASGWLTWFNGLMAIGAFALSATSSPADQNYGSKGRMGGAFGISMGLFVFWIIALATKTVPWLTWWTFAFACAFFALGLAAMKRKNPPAVQDAIDLERAKEEKRFRRSA